MTSTHHRRLESMYLSAPFNGLFQPSLTIREGEAEVSFDAGPHLHHAANAVHGSNYFKAVDDAAFFAVNSLVEDVFVLTVTFNIQLLRPISEGRMIAKGKVVNAGKTVWVADSILRDEENRLLARGTGTFMRSKIPLEDIPSYSDG
jgi:uncharacterized protein (TIGR00369 family)